VEGRLQRRRRAVRTRRLSEAEVRTWFATVTLHRASAREMPQIPPAPKHSTMSLYVRGIGWVDLRPRPPS
jgi:hypothetical protein